MVFMWVSPASADATVYRCGPEGSQRYSQIPCSEDSEQVVIRDQHKLIEPAGSPAESGGEGTSQQPNAQAVEEASPASNAEAFIQQLEKQRSEQLAEIDRDIAKLQSGSSNADGDEVSEAEAEEASELLAGLQNTRESIVAEYDAMILAARQRIEKP
jgi:hypothetical protein